MEKIRKRKYRNYKELYQELASLFQGMFYFCPKCNNIVLNGYCCNECNYGGGNYNA